MNVKERVLALRLIEKDKSVNGFLKELKVSVKVKKHNKTLKHSEECDKAIK